MYFSFTVFNIVTLLLLAATVLVAVKRFTLHMDSNWPLIYYSAVIAYWRWFNYSFDNYWVLAGLGCALLLRFEFLGAAVVKLIRAVELVIFAYIILRCVKLILLW